MRSVTKNLLERVSSEQIDTWRTLPREAQKALVGLVTARARHLQDERDPDQMGPDTRDELDRVFSALTSFSKREQPGFVFGRHCISCSDMRMRWNSICNGVAPISRANWFSV